MRYIGLMALAASPVFSQELNVYTYDSFVSDWGPGPILEAEFEKSCRCDLIFTPAGDGAAMLSRLRLEGGGTHADVALGLDQNLVPYAEETALFASHGLKAQEIEGAGVNWSNPNFIAYDWGQFAFVYRVADIETVPASLAELADSDLKIVIEDPRSSTPGLGLAMWVYDEFGEGAEDYWARLKDNVVTVTPGWSEAYTLFLEGEADMVLSYTTSPAYHRVVEEDDSFAAAVFEQGHGLQIELAGILEGSDQKARAKEFLHFLTTPFAQMALMNANWMYPVSGVEIPEGFDPPTSFPSRNFEASLEQIEAAKTAFENGLK